MTKSRDYVYDCGRLMAHVENTESELVSRSIFCEHFGHPEPPQIQLFALARRDAKPATQPILAVAYTKHCIAAQVLRPTSRKALDTKGSEPILHVHTFIPDFQNEGRETSFEQAEDEVINCLNIVALEDNTLVAGGNTVTVAEKNEKSSPTKVLLRGILSGNDNLHIAVVVGTNKSRLFSIELLVKRKLWKLQRQTDLPDDLFEVLPIDDRLTPASQLSSERFVPFCPQGGITSLTMFRLTTVGTHAAYLYIVYGDGNVLRLHHAGVFPSVWKRSSERGLSIDGALGKPALLRYHVQLPPNETELTVIPLPRFFPSLLSPLDILNSVENLAQERGSKLSSEKPLEALVYGSQASSDHFPALVFYSSEIQFVRPEEHLLKMQSSSSERKVLGSMVGGTKALVSGMIGALKWGLSSGAVEENTSSRSEEAEEFETANTPFPSLWSPPSKLYAANEFHDAPRRIESCVVDPGGRYAAACDSFGRVILFDLATKQLIRLWKGYRSGRCFWIQVALDHNKVDLRLMIHSSHRHVVEVWSMEGFARVTAVQVGRDARIVQCTLWSQASLQSTSFLLHSAIVNLSENFLEAVEDVQEKSVYVAPHNTGSTVSTGSTRIATLRLQQLQQLLSATNVDFSTEDVYKALTEIQLGDLVVALDLIASSTLIEEKLGGSSEFHKRAVDHCNMRLQEGLATGETEVSSHPHMKALSEKVQYHTQIAKVFDLLHKYEGTVVRSDAVLVGTPDFWWGTEAMGWLKTYEHCLGVSIDTLPEILTTGSLRLSSLFSSCHLDSTKDQVASQEMIIRFSESSRIRREILVHVLRPLLGDIFSLNVVYTVFGTLGTRYDTEYMLQCFGEWFMTLSKDEITQGMLSSNPPLTRFLRDLATRTLESWDYANPTIVLATLHYFCKSSSDLIRSFLLATICREAAAKASLNIEKSSYGKVLSRKVIEDWDKLLRQLRVCLLVSLRLGGAFQAPLSIELVDEGELFSVYEWIARDELVMSHDQEEISLLEQACAISSHSFDPSQPESDNPARLRVLQSSCLASKITHEERMEYFLDFDDEDRFGALLLFLKSHNNPPLLACHRSLLLSLEWVQDPTDLNHLHNSYMALKAITGDANNLLIAALSLEIWQRCSMVFRAQLFGWDDIQGISEDKFSPLLQNKDWFLPFGRIALKFLRVLRSTDFDIDSAPNFSTPTDTKTDTWPQVRPDVSLSRLVGRLFAVDKSALDTHCVVICALLVSHNVNSLVKCVPSIYDCFLPTSLSKPFASDLNVSHLRSAFVEDAIVARAKSWPNVVMEQFNLQEIETLAHVWVIDPKAVRSQFLLAIYELEKDHCVDDLLTRSVSQIDTRKFVEHGVDIACHRLNEFLSGKRMSSTDRRNVMGVLDADLCEWIETRANEGRWLVNELPPSKIQISGTNVLIMRLLSMSSSSNIDPSLRANINSLMFLCNLLVKEIGCYTSP